MDSRRGRLLAVIVLAVAVVTFSFSAIVPSRASSPVPSVTSPYTITPGVPWADTSGHLIQAHNGSIISATVGDVLTYYWIGQDLSVPAGKTSAPRDSAACYSSTDLVHWTPHGDVLSVSGSNGLPAPSTLGWESPPAPPEDASPQYLMGPTKVIYDAGHYVLWAGVPIKSKVTTSGWHRPAPYFLVGVATNDGNSPCDTYTWSQQSPFYPFGNPVGDIGIVQDGNNAFLAAENVGGCTTLTDPNCFTQPPPGGCCLDIYTIGGTDDTHLTSIANHTLPDCEAPSMFVDRSTSPHTYYLVASQKTSWQPNADIYTYTQQSSLATGWQSTWRTLTPTVTTSTVSSGCPNPTDETDTCSSQTMFVLPITSTSGTTSYVYMAERWDSSNIGGGSLGDSGYVWLPLKIDPTTKGLSINCNDTDWSINSNTGELRTYNSTFPNGGYFTLTNVSTGKVMEIADATTGVVDQAASNDGRTVQQWQVENISSVAGSSSGSNIPIYSIQNVDNGDYLVAHSDGSIQGRPTLRSVTLLTASGRSSR